MLGNTHQKQVLLAVSEISVIRHDELFLLVVYVLTGLHNTGLLFA